MHPGLISGARLYSETLTHGERHLSSRLESFGDIVFGFSVAQLGLQLDVPKVPADVLANPLKFVIYFVTFALIALFWVMFHRTMASGFRPTFIDVTLAFAYLSFIGLLPYATYANVRFIATGDSSRIGFALYLIVSIAVWGLSSVVELRNVRRRAPYATYGEQHDLFAAIAIKVLMAAFCVLALTATAAGSSLGGVFMIGLAFVPWIVGRAFPRLPGWPVLGGFGRPEPVGGTSGTT